MYIYTVCIYIYIYNIKLYIYIIIIIIIIIIYYISYLILSYIIFYYIILYYNIYIYIYISKLWPPFPSDLAGNCRMDGSFLVVNPPIWQFGGQLTLKYLHEWLWIMFK